MQLLPNRYPALHGLRVLGIVAVVQLHVSRVLVARGVLAESSLFSSFSRGLWFAMDLFFLLSGFLIGAILLDRRDEPPLRSFSRFWVRRGFRIVPPYLVVLATLSLVPTTWLWESSPTMPRWAEVLYLTNYGRGTPLMGWSWSLCVEEHFYLGAPLVLSVLAKRKPTTAIAILAGCFLLGPLMRSLVAWHEEVAHLPARLLPRAYTFTHARFDILLAGVLLAVLERHFAPSLERFFSHREVRVAVALLSLLMLPALLKAGPSTLAARLGVLAWGTLTALFWAPITLTMLHGDGALKRLLGARFFRMAATLGYGIYLVHVPVVAALGRFVRGPFSPMEMLAAWCALLTATLLVSAALAYLLHVTLETWMLSLRDKLAPSPAEAALAKPAATAPRA